MDKAELLDASGYHYMAIYKPFNVLSQYMDEGKKVGLGKVFNLPEGVYPLGRLDSDSEGLLLLTSHRTLAHTLLHPSRAHERTYWVQVEGEITEEALAQLRKGVNIRVDKKDYTTLPAKAQRIAPPSLPERNPPVRYRKEIPTSWIALTLSEGKNRQVRRMTAAVGFPTLRLVRYSIEQLSLGNMQPGELKVFDRQSFYTLLKINADEVPTAPAVQGAKNAPPADTSASDKKEKRRQAMERSRRRK